MGVYIDFTFIYFQLFNNDPELMMKIYCAVHLIGLTSTCTNPVLYAFFNENLRKEFEFMAEILCPQAIFRSRSTRRSHRSSPNFQTNPRNVLQKIRPRRDENNVVVITQLVAIGKWFKEFIDLGIICVLHQKALFFKLRNL